ncbi:hypothetical protein FHQ18_11560 [Deferribacter autotrophicus]|uniref:Uncharacterized protein n=1 Tax=Deferribacter autotrophicus TaxID=500465 RepID=A0A5A8F3X5_9BACT|nr:hypothetical protein [Deferribacter autotrophicus]KAA0257194.1 hypothetical protein FHQ18_11560 [Deferribacter autotrophicus]
MDMHNEYNVYLLENKSSEAVLKTMNDCAKKCDTFDDFMLEIHNVLADEYLSVVLDSLFSAGFIDFESFYTFVKSGLKLENKGAKCLM